MDFGQNLVSKKFYPVVFTGFFIGLWILMSATLMAVFEYPQIFAMVPNIERIKEFLLESMLMKLDEVRSIIYFFLSLFCFMQASITLFAGFALLITSILLLFSAINKRVDAMDQNAADQGPRSSTGGGGGMGNNNFMNISSVNHHTMNSNAPTAGLMGGGGASNIQYHFQQPKPYNASGEGGGGYNPHTGLMEQQKQGTFGSYQDV